jgi:4-amino-4-deoxy-L-arabinose transferase-like glycosyltransferase
MGISLIQRWNRLSFKRREYLVLALLVLLAALLRFYHLESIPVGLSGDEGADGLGAKRILRGEELPLFITEDFGEEPMHTYLVALSFALWGSSLWAIRFVSAFIGVLAVPVIFWLAKELLPHEPGSPSLIPLLSAFFVATSYWHIIYSRAGLEVVSLTLFSSAVLYFLWRGVHTGRKWAFIVCGLLLGASLYSYRGARFLPILLTLFFGGWVIASREFRRRHLVNLVLVTLVAAIVCLPLGLYAVAYPEIFFAREMHVSIFNPDWGRGSPLQAFGVALAKTMSMFNLQGDPQFDRNPGRRPVLDPTSSLCFLIGLVIALWRWKRASYLFIVVWFLVMALPGAFTAEALPHFHRGIGALPPLCLMCALGASRLKDWLQRSIPVRGASAVSWAALSLIMVATSVLSIRDYFLPWQQRLDSGVIIGSDYMEATEVMNATRLPDGVWILPASPLRPRNLPYYEVDFLYDGPEPEYTLNVDETTAPEELTEICQGHGRAAVINWKQYVLEEAYLSLNSDPKGLLDFLFRKYGGFVSSEEHDSFNLVTYTLPNSPQFSIAESFQGLGLDFGESLRLEGVAFGGSAAQATSTPQEVERKVLPSGKEGWVVLRWKALRDLDRNYKVAVYLLDSQGRVVGQVDRLLLSSQLEPTSLWQAEQLEIDYYTLPCFPATPPGAYSVEVAVYDADTMQRLHSFDPESGLATSIVPIGTMEVTQPLTPPEVEPMERVADENKDLAPGLHLLGYDLPVPVVSPGETVRLALYWQAIEDVNRDYQISVQLIDQEGNTWLEQKGRPVDGTYPTTEWDENEVLRDWHDLVLPPDAPQGRHELLLQVLEDGEVLGELQLGSLEVQGRPRQFTVPLIQHPLEATVGSGVLFLGYDLKTDQVQPGEPVRLTLYWQALQEMQVSYTVFTHLLDVEETVWGQADSLPRGGEAPTTSWLQGEVITDEYEIVVDQAAPPGTYIVEVGMYDASTGLRLPIVADGERLAGDRLLLQEIQVLP